LYPVTEPHMRDETTAYIRTHVASARADCKEVHILHSSSGSIYTVQNRAATCFHGAAQITLIQLIRAFLAIQLAFQIKIAMLNIAIQEDLPNALALVTRSMKICSWVSLTGGFAVPIPRIRGWFTAPQPIHAKHQSSPPDA
jgi:hypothetical protein